MFFPPTADSRDSSQSRDGSVEMSDSVATVEMDLDNDDDTHSQHAVAENAAAIGKRGAGRDENEDAGL